MDKAQTGHLRNGAQRGPSRDGARKGPSRNGARKGAKGGGDFPNFNPHPFPLIAKPADCNVIWEGAGGNHLTLNTCLHNWN